MIKASGIWVSPMEVETRLLSHPAVAQAVVVAAPDADGLEKPVAYVLLAAGAEVTEAELIEYCREGLPSFKRPRAVVFTDGFPTTATGKIRRVDLRSMAARRADHDRLSEVATASCSTECRSSTSTCTPPGCPRSSCRGRSWLQGFAASAAMERLYDADGTVVPSEFDAYLAAEGVDTALLMCEYSPKVTGLQVIEDMLPIAAQAPDRIKIIANVNPHLHYPVDEEVRRQLALGAVALKIHPVHAGVAANDRMLYPAYEACQAAGVPVVVHCGTSTFPGAANTFGDPVVLDDVLRDFRVADPGARARRPGLVVRRGGLPRAVQRPGLDRALRPAAVPAPRLLRPPELGQADQADDLRHGLAGHPRHRRQRPRRRPR